MPEPKMGGLIAATSELTQADLRRNNDGMKRLLLLLPLLLAQPVSASIYANLETKEVTGINDGDASVRISDGKKVVVTYNPKAKVPTAVKHLDKGGEMTVPMNNAGYRYYLELFKKLTPEAQKPEDGDYLNPIYGIKYAFQCKKEFSGQARLECETAYSKKYCSISGMEVDQKLIATKDYPVDGLRLVRWRLNKLEKAGDNPSLTPNSLKCKASEVTIGCTSGSCWVYPSGGEYGYYPNKRNSVLIDGKKFSWVGEPPEYIQHEMWNKLKDGSVFAYQLVYWPYEAMETGTEVLAVPKGLKEKLYRMSLVKP